MRNHEAGDFLDLLSILNLNLGEPKISRRSQISEGGRVYRTMWFIWEIRHARGKLVTAFAY
jgi:hypothetical protein